MVRLGEIVSLKSGNTLQKNSDTAVEGVPYLKVADMNLKGNKKVITTSGTYVKHVNDIEKYIIPPNSIIFPKRGGAIATNKKRIVNRNILVDSNTMAIVCGNELDFEYLYYWFMGIDLWSLNNGTSVPQINNKNIEPLIFPLPPIAEQHRIVEKVDRLMALCDRLEENIKHSEEVSRSFAEAIGNIEE